MFVGKVSCAIPVLVSVEVNEDSVLEEEEEDDATSFEVSDDIDDEDDNGDDEDGCCSTKPLFSEVGGVSRPKGPGMYVSTPALIASQTSPKPSPSLSF